MKFFKNKNTSIRSSQGYSDVAAPGAGGSDPAVLEYELVWSLDAAGTLDHALDLYSEYPDTSIHS